MMTKQEVKDEHKNAEGDPKIKAKIRQRMREIMVQQMMTNVPEADVIITNPTHVAVAIVYNKADGAPKVVAKGLRKRAEKIKMIARNADIPIMEAPPLARSLYRNTKVGAFIPAELYGAVAIILAKLHRLGFKKYKTE
jgi:flagellar biosynthesis protein FlhB